MATKDWKQTYADAADATLAHPIVDRCMAELRMNLGVSDDGLPAYGIAKVATYAAQVARAHALGVDPELLRVTSEEANSLLLEQAAEASLAGIPVHMLNITPGEERP